MLLPQRGERILPHELDIGLVENIVAKPLLKAVSRVKVMVIQLYVVVQAALYDGLHHAFHGGVTLRSRVLLIAVAAGVHICFVVQNAAYEQR